MNRNRMRRAGLAMLLTAVVSVPLAAAAAPYVGPSSLGSPTIHTLERGGVTIVGIADNGYVATNLAVWPGIGHPIRPAFPNPTVTAGNYAIADINNLGVAAGTYRATTGFDRGFVWTPGGAFVDIGTPAGSLGSFVRVTGIDDEGRIVGNFAATSGACGSSVCGFFGEPKADGTYTLVPIGPDGAQFLPQDIGGGLVVGPGWTWAADTDTWTPLSGPGGGPAAGWAVNESGQIAGFWIPVAGTTEALYWHGATAQPTQLGTLPGDTMSQSNGIGEDGTVAGWSATASTGPRRGWIWNGGELQDLGHIPGGTATSDAFDVHDDLVVGTASGRAVFWDLGGTFDIDYPPEIIAPASIIAIAGELMTIDPDISDFDGDPFTVSCPSLPEGAVCEADGTVTWQPDPTDVSTTPHDVTITATQDDEPLNIHSVTILVLVREGVTLDPIGDKQVEAGSELRFALTSTGDTRVGYSYTPRPTGAILISSTSEFVWTPTTDQVGEHVVTFTVTAFTTGATDSETITITVTDPAAPPPEPVTITVDESIAVGDSVTITIDLPVVITVVETVGVADTATVRLPLVISVTETVGVTDGVAVRLPVRITITEVVGVGDGVGITSDAPIRISISETVGVHETVTVRPPVVIAVTESVGVVETAIVEALGTVTVQSILDYLVTLSAGDFRGSGQRRALERLVAAAGGSIDATDSALKRVDGCGGVADRNDFIVDCDAQREVRRLLMLWREQLTSEE